jgi:cytochrome d ubiquinol oxidase subunit II
VGNFFNHPICWLTLLFVAGAIILLVSGLRNGNEMRAFYGSCFVLLSLLATGAATMFPVMLYSTLQPDYSMTAYTSASTPTALSMASIWWPLALILTIVYFVYLFKYYTCKVQLSEDDQGYHD